MNEEQPIKIKIDDFERQKVDMINKNNNFIRQGGDKIGNHGAAEKTETRDKSSVPMKSPIAAPSRLRNRNVFLPESSAERLRQGGIENNNKNGIWMKIGKLSLCLLIFLLPLFFLPLTIAPLEINKQVLASFLVLISFICYLANSIETRKIVYHRSLLGSAVLALLMVSAASAAFSQAKSVSIFGDFIQSDSLLCFAVYGLAFYLAGIFFRKKDFNKIGVIFLASLVLTAVFGLLQLLGYFILPHISSSLKFTGQTGFNSLGSFANWSVFIAFGLVLIVSALASLRLPLILKVVLAVIALFIIGELIIVNYSFLWMAIALCMLVLTAYCFTIQKKINVPLAVMIISLFFVLISSSLPAIVKTPAEVRPSFSSTFDIAKQTIWPKSNQSLAENGKNILFGSGPATFSYDYSLYRSNDSNQTDFWQVRFSQGFSFITSFLATGGLLGILAILFLIFSFARQAIKSLENKKALVYSAGALFMIIMLALFPPSAVQFIFVFMALGLMAPESSAKEISFLNVSKTKSFLAFIALTVFIVGSMALFYLVGQKYAAAVYYQKGITAYNQSGDLIKSLVNLDRASALDSGSDQYLRALSQVLLLDVGDLIGKSKDDASKASESGARIQNEIALAVQTARRAADLNPSDSLNWNNLAGIYENIIPLTAGADNFAVENYKKAIQLDPKNPAGYVNLSRVLLAIADYSKEKDKELWQKNIDEAKSSLEKSIELKPDYAAAHFMAAMVYAREEKNKEAIGKLEETKLYAPLDAGLAFQLGVAYYNDNQFDKAKAELERAVGINKNYSNARYSLGLVYDRLGNREMAIEQFEEVAKLNPDNEEVKKMLESLKKGEKITESDNVPPLEEEAVETGVILEGKIQGLDLDNVSEIKPPPPIEPKKK